MTPYIFLNLQIYITAVRAIVLINVGQ